MKLTRTDPPKAIPMHILHPYKVTVMATVTKTLSVEAASEEAAIEAAHEEFTVLSDGNEECYEQDCLDVEEVKS